MKFLLIEKCQLDIAAYRFQLYLFFTFIVWQSVSLTLTHTQIFTLPHTHAHSLSSSISLSYTRTLSLSGFQVLVGFKDRVRLYNILIDKFKLYRETIQKSCRELRYSNGCQYWAGASAMTLVIYDSASFTQLMAFQGHMMAIRRLVWAPGDMVRNVL